MSASLRFLLVLTMVIVLLPASTGAATLFFDGFDSPSSAGSVNEAVWRLPTGPGTFFGNTQIKPPEINGFNTRPIVSGGTARLWLDTYNPTGPGTFWGHEIQTIETFTPGPNGISIEARIRFGTVQDDFFSGTPPGGIIGGFFTWGLDDSLVRDEIDFELLTNDLDNEKIFTNVFDGARFDQSGIGANLAVPGLDLTDWSTYTINWFEDKVQWLLDGTLIREQQGVQLDRPSEVRINVWVPNEGFQAAYNPLLLPAFCFDPEECDQPNQRYLLEVDYVQVSAIPVPPAFLLFGSAMALLGFLRTRCASSAAA